MLAQIGNAEGQAPGIAPGRQGHASPKAQRERTLHRVGEARIHQPQHGVVDQGADDDLQSSPAWILDKVCRDWRNVFMACHAWRSAHTPAPAWRSL